MSTSGKRTVEIGPVVGGLTKLTQRALNHLEREWPTSKPSAGCYLLRGLIAASNAHAEALHQIFFGKRRDGGEEGRLYPSTIPVVRSMLEILMLAHFLLDDLGPRAESYTKAGWREQALVHERLKRRFGKKEPWSKWLDSHAEVLRQQEALVQLSAAERADPKKVPYWKNPGKFIRDIRDPDRKQTCLDLEVWYYGELSAGAHAAYLGLATVFSLVVQRDTDQRQRAQKGFRLQMLPLALAFQLMLLGEIELEFKFGMGKKLVGLWPPILLAREDIEELYNRRYAGMAHG